MPEESTYELVRLIGKKAKGFGADVAGVASVADLKRSPSHRISGRMPEFSGVGTRDAGPGRHGIVVWPEGARSAIVIGVEHPAHQPELDWWQRGESGGNTPGNRMLMRIISELAAWLEREREIRCFPLPYHIEHGGVYMKDAAVLAGLGRIGRNNMLVTPQYGPRVRLRVMLTDVELPSAGVTGPDPCEGCDVPCLAACPQQAFAEKIYYKGEYGLDELPGRTGVYSRFRCNLRMSMDASASESATSGAGRISARLVKYCRECELACPVGGGSLGVLTPRP
jgi:epoxyqueuosine reductase